MMLNNNEKFRSFKSKENIHKKEVRPYHGFGYLSLISDTIDLAKGASGKYCKFATFYMTVFSKTDISRLENESKRIINSELSNYIP